MMRNQRLFSITIVLLIGFGAGSAILGLARHDWAAALYGALYCAFGGVLGWYVQAEGRTMGRRPVLPRIVMLCFTLAFAVLFVTRLLVQLVR